MLDTQRDGSPNASKVKAEKERWLLAMEDQRDQNGKGLPGMLHNISLPGYLR